MLLCVTLSLLQRSQNSDFPKPKGIKCFCAYLKWIKKFNLPLPEDIDDVLLPELLNLRKCVLPRVFGDVSGDTPSSLIELPFEMVLVRMCWLLLLLLW